MLRGYRYRLYPTKDQMILIAKHLGCCRYVYNWALNLKNQIYHNEGISLSGYALMNQLPMLKEELPWLKEVNAQSLQQSMHHLSRAFTNFFEGRAEEPTFKKKHDPEQSFMVPQSYTVDFKQGTVKLPKIGAIKTVFHRTFVGTMKSATVIRRSTGRYFISIVVEDGRKSPKPADPIPDQTIGIDMGLSHYAVLSTGDAVANPKYLRNAQTRLAVLQRRLDRKKKGSRNRNKARFKVARCHQKIADQRRDFQHQLSSRLVRENQALAVESLNVNGMVKNPSLARAIGDAGWGMFLSMLAYKCQEAGKTLLKIGVFEPSSKTCSVCGYRKVDLTLKDRAWTCPDCGTCHDRDLNAAINIRNFALAGVERAEEPVDSLPLGRGMKQEAPCVRLG
ncbi:MULTISPECIES: RNA-guided endonuclease TnpB family protein [unclassified Methanoculleus]|jgi:putative transposase|uniref:RNA-guided endonuclease TnpB family protein n=1 Tax=Methanoculleus palmolei TaxID=72612 RepID=A0ABD8A7R6_9EURY|nr:RNA-guided endonuclease TnpB family protein [Methanoculleus sp. UBA377]WOX55578.1 RNA-guided endonuclease TnpB family protein [Methanoculleus palmolei]